MFSLIITLANSIYLNNISEERSKKSKTTKRNIISLNFSTEKVEKFDKIPKLTGGSVKLKP